PSPGCPGRPASSSTSATSAAVPAAARASRVRAVRVVRRFSRCALTRPHAAPAAPPVGAGSWPFAFPAGELEEDVLEVGALEAHLVEHDTPGGGRLAHLLGGGAADHALARAVQGAAGSHGHQEVAERLGLGVRTRTVLSAPAVSAARVDWATRRPTAHITTRSTVLESSAAS